jgi:hypothetical protein
VTEWRLARSLWFDLSKGARRLITPNTIRPLKGTNSNSDGMMKQVRPKAIT